MKKLLIILGTMIWLLSVAIICTDEFENDISVLSEDDNKNLFSENIMFFKELSQEFSLKSEKLSGIKLQFVKGSNSLQDNVYISIKNSVDQTVYQTKFKFAEDGKNIVPMEFYVNIPIRLNEEYCLDIYSENEIGIYINQNNSIQHENNELIVDGERINAQVSILYAYSQVKSIEKKMMECICASVIYILFCIGVCLEKKWLCIINSLNKRILVFYEKPYNDIGGVIIECIICMGWMFYSRIDMQLPVKMVYIILSYFAMKKFDLSIKYLQTNMYNKVFQVGFPIVTFITAFSLVGNRGIVYPLNSSLSLGRIVTFMGAAIWLIPVILLFLREYEKAGLDGNRIENQTKFLAICATVLIIPACVALCAFNPGISSYDTNQCLAIYAHDMRNMPNWHPPFYVFLLRVIISIWDSTYAVVFVQFIFWEFVVLNLFAFLYRKGISDKVLIFSAFFLGINTSNVLYLCTIWKDIPYGIALLWLTIVISKLVLDKDYYVVGWKIYIELVSALILVFFMRQNGVVPYILSVLALGIVCRKNKKMVFSLVFSLILICIIRYPIYSSWGIVETTESAGGKYIGLGQDILAAYYNGGDLSEETLEMVNVLTKQNNSEFAYNPYWANSSYDLDLPISEFVINYIDTFFKNPVIMSKSILCRNDCVWDIFKGEDAIVNLVNYLGNWDGNDNWNDYYPHNVWTDLSSWICNDTSFTAESQLFDMIFWRGGIYFVLGLFIIFYMQIKNFKKEYYIIFVPYYAQIIGLILSTGWSDFRYYWPLNLMIVALLHIVIVAKSSLKE